jgi:diguanylate cyclase (GGDEF)-like protein
MMESQLLYVGNDQSFDGSLSRISKTLKISYQRITPKEIRDKNSSLSENLLAIVDEGVFGGGKDEISPQLKSAMLVMAISDTRETSLISEDIGQEYEDILLKTISERFLQKKIGFYLDRVQSRREPDSKENTENTHELKKKNRQFSRQIASLQKQLNQVGSDLHVQGKVLETINKISQLSRRINCLDMDIIASVCVDQIPKLISAKFSSLYTYDAGKEVLHLLRHNHPYMIARTVALREHLTPMILAIRQKKLLLVKDFAEWEVSEETSVARVFSRNYRSNSCIIAPLLSGEKILGVLNLADKIDSPSFDHDRDLPPVQLLCEMIGSAMSNIELYEEVQKQTQMDSMTNLLNHHAFYNLLDKEVHRTRRYGNNLSLLMMDMDNLKQINDQHGHLAGDAVLMHVTKKIIECIRDTDVAARYGGDEFAIILPNTSLSDAMHVAERMVSVISSNPVRFENQQLNVSVSIGLGQYHGNISVEKFMQESDTAMFEAKSTGKNRVHICES